MKMGKVLMLKRYFWGLILNLIFILSSLLASIIIYFDYNRPTHYNYLYILPLSFGVLSIVFISIYINSNKNFGVLFIISIYYLRMVIIPIVMRYDKYLSVATNNAIYQNMNKAILLMIYELFFVFLTIFIYKFKVKKIPRVKLMHDDKFILKIPFQTKFIVVLATLYLIISFSFYPTLLKNYSGFFNMINVAEFKSLFQSVPKLIRVTTFLLFDILQIIYCFIIMLFFKKKLRNELSAIFLSILFVLPIINITSDTKAYNVLLLIACLLFLLYLYPKKMKILIAFFILTVIFIAFGGLVIKSINTNSGINGASSLLQAYFGGPANVAAAISINNDVIKMRLPWDFFYVTPILGDIFNTEITTVHLFNYAMFGSYIRNDQIIPMIGQGYYHFGFLLAPIFSVIMTLLALKFDSKQRSTINPFKKFIFMYFTICTSIMPVAYNFTIFFTYLIQLFLPIWFFYKSSKIVTK